MERKELIKGRDRGLYASPSVKVLKFRANCVLCSSPFSITGTNEDLSGESYEREAGEW